MKQWWTTGLLLIVLAGGVWYVAASGLLNPSEEEKGVNRLVALINENLQMLEIRTDENKLTLNFSDGNWWISDKPDVPLNRSKVDGWISTVMDMVHSGIVVEDAKDLQPFGLTEPAETYIVHQKGKNKIEIFVGDELPTMGTRYVRVAGSNTVYKVNSADLANLNKTEFDFIRANPMTVDYDRTSRIDIKWRGYRVLMERVAVGASPNENKWKLNGKKDQAHSDAKNMLTKLVSWETKVATRKVSELDFSNPDLTVVLTEDVDGNKRVREYVGTIGENTVWVAKKGGNWAYALDGDAIHAYVTGVGEVENGKTATD